MNEYYNVLIKLVRFTVVPSNCNQGPCQVVAEEGKSECSRASLDDASNILVRGMIFYFPYGFYSYY